MKLTDNEYRVLIYASLTCGAPAYANKDITAALVAKGLIQLKPNGLTFEATELGRQIYDAGGEGP